MGDMADYYSERDEEEAMTREYPPGHRFSSTPRRYVDDPVTPASRAAYANRPRSYNYWGRQFKTPARKAHTMANASKNPRLRKLESELDANLSLQRQLQQEAQLLKDDIRKADVPAEPPARHDMFRVMVQFSTQGPQYTYLLARSGAGWYTTGTKNEQKKFDSWFALCDWLNSTAWHSPLDVLGVDIEQAYPTERTGQVPF